MTRTQEQQQQNKQTSKQTNNNNTKHKTQTNACNLCGELDALLETSNSQPPNHSARSSRFQYETFNRKKDQGKQQSTILVY